MKSKLIFIFLVLSLNNSLYSREIGQTEITAENGVEVFQDEKYYLIKQNVKIVSDDFTLNADEVKIFFRDDLYDIKIINAFGNVILISETNLIKAEGDELLFYLDDEKLNILGNNSIFSNEDIIIKSNGKIIIYCILYNTYYVLSNPGSDDTIDGSQWKVHGNCLVACSVQLGACDLWLVACSLQRVACSLQLVAS